ncbi:MAG: hypothetical protein KAI79_20510 [Bacteroidales bacterium]|nr:hypothetical protein [Bacteroidales bacterium]
MKTLFSIIIFLSIIVGTHSAQAQCSNLAKHEGILVLDTSKYIHDGRFNAITLKEGDDIYIYKAFYAGENYRIGVVTDKELPFINFELTDFKKKEVIFNNSKGESSYDFSPKKSQRAIIHITIPKAANGVTPKKGCVAVIFGLKKL